MSTRHDVPRLARIGKQPSNEEQILCSALQCFLEKGYHGTTVKDIARRAGLSVPGLYHHFPSKMALLERLLDETMDDLNAATERALTEANNDPVERFKAVVGAHVQFHCERSAESFIGNSELRSVSPAFLRHIMQKRDRQQGFFDQVINEGIQASVFQIPWPHPASLALASMCTAVATWYHRDGPLSPHEVVEIYCEIGLGMVGAIEARDRA